MYKTYICAIIFLVSCYRDFHRLSPSAIMYDSVIPKEVHELLLKREATCVAKVNNDREEAFKARRKAHFSGVVGSSVTTIMGAGAGTLGAVALPLGAGIGGGLTLLSGLVTVWLVESSDKAELETKEQEALTLLGSVREAIREFEAFVIDRVLPDSGARASEAEFKQALKMVNETLISCGSEEKSKVELLDLNEFKALDPKLFTF